MTTRPKGSGAKPVLRRRKFVLAASGAAVAAAVAVMLALVARDDAPAQPADSARAAPAAPKAAFPPSPPPGAEPSPAAVADPAPAAGEEEGRPALCAGCLSERAVLDVVETYLRHLDPVLLHGGLWAHPLADVAPETPGPVYGLPKLPPGLLEAPEFNPMGMKVDTREYAVETTWIVWVQTGWVSPRAIEQGISLGELPEVALSWPPIKKEVFVAVDGRTGKLYPHGIFNRTTAGLMPPHPAHYEAVLDATRERAASWFRGGGGDLGSR
ncbi:MAG: hypothetical protein OXH09_04155 [Gammaproteobacteria bacterium]|nr:hypothetical protein [Gammaproteobacteria bacterium]